ncbi:MAG TPA: phage tail protein [Polyangia bacterium]|jgi:phage tail-like protein|nr:phage tail protein [Polyangia bacterium]
MGETGKRSEAFGAYYFRVDLMIDSNKYGDTSTLPFRSCSGLKSESAVVEVEEGGFNGTTRKLIGRTKFPNIVLKQGFCASTSVLWKLRQSFLSDSNKAASKTGDQNSGKGRQTPNRFSGTITQMGPNGAAAKWVFAAGWVCKWEGPDFDASKNEISIESIEIAHEGLMMLSGG